MPHAYTEDQLVGQPAIAMFEELGWQVAGPPPNAGAAGEPRYAGLPKPESKTKERDSSGSRSGATGTGASSLSGDVSEQEPLWAFGSRTDGIPEPRT